MWATPDQNEQALQVEAAKIMVPVSPGPHTFDTDSTRAGISLSVPNFSSIPVKKCWPGLLNMTGYIFPAACLQVKPSADLAKHCFKVHCPAAFNPA